MRRTPMAPKNITTSSRAANTMSTGMPSSFKAGLSSSRRDAVGHDGVVRYDHHAVGGNGAEPAINLDREPGPGDRNDFQIPGSQDGQHRHVAGKDPDLAIA